MSETYQKINPPIYEGKASRLWNIEGYPNLLILERKDELTKLDGEVRAKLGDKGIYANKISNLAFRYLESKSIPTHYYVELNDRETVVKKTEPILLEVIVRNTATGSLCRRLPIKEGTVFDEPIIELDFKSDEYGDPLINEHHALALKLATKPKLDAIRLMALQINRALKEFFEKAGFTFVDIKLEFGIDEGGNIILIDEISPDTIRIWGRNGESYDKDIFRKGGEAALEDVLAAYRMVYERLAAIYDQK